ncbi:putative bifunctional dTTP/UTP pyrophosphatase/methyltransferase protein isoform X2 [Arvicanthis niloticus]|uniref:putative bifunctional dTTP/UTP pyrophosphatase/methyltransferase protein isoform X2 n=1 Tax=Arvicanthis niloticus TaxID=61156 RepID=UPI00402BDB57
MCDPGDVTRGPAPSLALAPPAPLLRGFRVILASASPRRREIFGLTTAQAVTTHQAPTGPCPTPQGVSFEVIPPAFEESLSKAALPRAQDYARETARGKALEVAARVFQDDPETPYVVIGADTVVAVDGLILEKPADQEDAVRMLRRLSGKEHGVITGVAIVVRRHGAGPTQEVLAFHEETRVTFSPLSDDLVREDKAGAYALQARGAVLAERVCGDVLNVVGFPLNRVCRELTRLLLGPGQEVTSAGMGSDVNRRSDITAGRGDVGDRT